MTAAAPGAYNHRQWMDDTGALAGNFAQIGNVLDATLSFLQAVGAGHTQISGTVALADEGKTLANAGMSLRREWDAAFRDVNAAVAATRGDRAEAKEYAE
jgi:hypothetical protein